MSKECCQRNAGNCPKLCLYIFKKGSYSGPINHQPISLTSIYCRALERIVAEHIYACFEQNAILSDNQYGFRCGITTHDQLLLTYNFATSELDCGWVVDVVLFDFSKAFIVVSHFRLIDRLKCIGIRGSLLKCLSSFLQGRIMYVSVSGVSSDSQDVISGVPQGSVLHPFLFLVYVNHLPLAILNNCNIFLMILKCIQRFAHLHLSLWLWVNPLIRMTDNICSVASSWGSQS